MARKNYLNGSLFGNFNSNVEDKFNYLFSNLIDAHYDFLLGQPDSEFKAISLSDVATGQSNGSMQYPNSARVVTRRITRQGISSLSMHLAVKVRPTNIDGSILPDPFQTSTQDERNFAIGMHEWAVCDLPVEQMPTLPAGSEVTCFYADDTEAGLSKKTLFFKAGSAGSSFLSMIAQPFTDAGNFIAGLFSSVQDPALMSQYQSTYLNIPPQWDGVLPTIPQAVITSAFGPRRPPLEGASDNHPGIDIAGGNLRQYPGGLGSPIFAVNAGKVYAVNPNSPSAGKLVWIDHPGGWRTKYVHLDSILVKAGQEVYRGQAIGTMGNTGNSTATHLHFGVEKNNKKLDPLLVFGWNYGWAKPSTEAAYRQRIQGDYERAPPAVPSIALPPITTGEGPLGLPTPTTVAESITEALFDFNDLLSSESFDPYGTSEQ